MRMYLLIDVIVSKETVNPEKGTTAYQVFFSYPKKIIGMDKQEALLPETGKIKSEHPLSKGLHLLLVKISTYQGQVFYTAIKEVKDAKLVEVLSKVD